MQLKQEREGKALEVETSTTDNGESIRAYHQLACIAGKLSG
jgi:hypothetical protein